MTDDNISEDFGRIITLSDPTIDDSKEKLQKKLEDYTNLLLNEGILDDQFMEVQKLQTEDNPNFVLELLTDFFKDFQRDLNDMENIIEQHNVKFKDFDNPIYRLRSSSLCIGAQRVYRACTLLRTLFEEQNIEGCKNCLQELKYEYLFLKDKLETLLKLESQITKARKD